MSIFQRLTLKALRQNKMRTAVTIVGIILSTALITAVTTGVSSCFQFMLEVVEVQDGTWYGKTYGIPEEEQKELAKKEEIQQFATWGNVTYGKLPRAAVRSTPYLHISSYGGDFTKLLSVKILEGRLPKDSTELILPRSVNLRGKMNYQTGDTITLETGLRKDPETGKVWWQDYPYEKKEKFQTQGNKTYHIVGFYDSAQLGYWGEGEAPGYVALTLQDSAIRADNAMCYYSLSDPKICDNFTSALEKEYKKKFGEDECWVTQNYMYLKLLNGSLNSSAKQLLIITMVVLIAIVMFGSVALIYNAFSISVNERKKQYGILASVGASKRQLQKMVLVEAGVVSLIGIPLGVLAGIGGLSLAFYGLRDEFSLFLYEEGGIGIPIHMSAALWAIILAVVVAYVTVLISAYIPARKTMKVSVIEVIRQNDDVVEKTGKLKTSRFTKRLFGLEGVIASKNFKRNRKKYRATVVSLFISIVLFVSVNSFCQYMTEAMEQMNAEYNCDIFIRDAMDSHGVTGEEVYDTLREVGGITKSSQYYSYYMLPLVTEAKYLDKEEIAVSTDMTLIFVEDSIYKEFLQKQKLNPDIYTNPDKITATVYDHIIHWDNENNRYIDSKVLNNLPETVTVGIPNEEWTEEVGYEEKWDSQKRFYNQKEVALGQLVEEVPFGVDHEKNSGLLLMFPQSFMDKFVNVSASKVTGDMDRIMTFNANDPYESFAQMQNCLDEMSQKLFDEGTVMNVDRQFRVSNAMMKIMRIFSFGFILLISLIAIANVFHTIATNVILRRREFAMLRSVGLTQRGFYKMMYYECCLYGIKGLLFGIPVSLGITAYMSYEMNRNFAISFRMPWQLIGMAILGVFSVVFITMFYAIRKIQKDNVAETLKQDIF